MILLHIQEPLHSDPDIEIGGYLTLERADGRSVWRQRLKCINKFTLSPPGDTHYYMQPVKDTE